MAKRTRFEGEKTTVESAKESRFVRDEPGAEKQPAPRRYTDEERHGMIAESAYYRAKQSGFQGDLALDDWLRAEAEVDALLCKDR